MYAVIKIGRQYRLHIFRGAFVKYEADLRKAPALSVDQTVQPDGSGINQLLNEVQAPPHQGVPHALMRKEQFAKFPLEFGGDRKSTRLNSSHSCASRMTSSACK